MPLPQFLNEISSLNTQLQTFSSATQDLASLHDAALRSTESSTGYANGASARLDSAVASCSAQARMLKDVLKALERDVLLTEREAYSGGADHGVSTKRGQWEKAKRDVSAGLHDFNSVRTHAAPRARARKF